MTPRRLVSITLLAAMGVGSALRWYSPGRVALWRDEAQFLNIAVLPDAGAIITFLRLHESHPPLLYLLAHFISPMSTDATVPVGWFVLLISIAAIPATFWVAAAAQGTLAGSAAALLTAASLPLAAFSVQLRPYAVVSLLLLISTGALVKGINDPRPRWRVLWGAAAVLTLYTHHMGVLLLIAQIAVITRATAKGQPEYGRRLQWATVVLGVGLAGLPAFVLLGQQSVAAGHRAAPTSSIAEPFIHLLGALMAYPAELLLPAAVTLLAIGKRRRWDVRPAATVPAFVLLGGLLCLTLASYRSDFLVSFILLSLGPLGAVVVGVSIGELLRARRRFEAAVAIEVAIAAVTVSTLALQGFQKTNVHQAAAYVAAGAHRTDMLILAAGVVGPAFSRYFDRPLSRIDFPVAGAVSRFEFDHHFERVSASSAVRMVLDSIAAAASEDRRIWLVTPSSWISDHAAPMTVSWQQYGGLGVIDAARANLVRQLVARRYGMPLHAMSVTSRGRSLEMLTVELYQLPIEEPDVDT